MADDRDAYLPPAIGSQDDRIVFVHVLSARHSLVFDVSRKEVAVESDLVFETVQRGRPVIDLSPLATADGVEVVIDVQKKCPTVQVTVEPSRSDVDAGSAAATFTVLDLSLPAGLHRAHFTYRMGAGVVGRGLSWGQDGVRCFFQMDDYRGVLRRHFLERFLPANLEFDQHAVHIDVEVIGTSKPHVLIANGTLSGDAAVRWSVAYPEWYTASCPFFFLAPRSQVQRHEVYASRLGAGDLAITLFSDEPPPLEVPLYERLIAQSLETLQAHFGPFPHDQLILYATSKPSMEYAGAATVTPVTLFHELLHCYFGRSVLARDGDSGWIDEAIAHWYTELRPFGEPVRSGRPSFLRNMGAQSPYRRGTTELDGVYGAQLLRYFDGILYGGLIRFLADLHRRYTRRTLDSSTFQREIESHVGSSFAALFDHSVYGLR